MSSILDRYDIDNNIISFPGHVVVEFRNENGDWLLLDPDFGVELNASIDQLIENPNTYKDRYISAGYSEKEIEYLFSIFSKQHKVFDNVYHFMTLRFIFEKLSYVIKWLLPMFLIAFSLLYFFGIYRFKK